MLPRRMVFVLPRSAPLSRIRRRTASIRRAFSTRRVRCHRSFLQLIIVNNDGDAVSGKTNINLDKVRTDFKRRVDRPPGYSLERVRNCRDGRRPAAGSAAGYHVLRLRQAASRDCPAGLHLTHRGRGAPTRRAGRDHTGVGHPSDDRNIGSPRIRKSCSHRRRSRHGKRLDRSGRQ